MGHWITILWEIKQCKSMASVRYFCFMVPCLGWCPIVSPVEWCT